MVSYDSLASREDKIAVVGLGYVGLPLAVHLSKHFDVVGYDLRPERIAELQAGSDRTLEVSAEALAEAPIHYTADPRELSSCRLLIVAVPTPIDGHHSPDLGPLLGASATVGKHLVRGSCVVFESTVYPGATEDECVPILARESGLKYQEDFTAGYSPERINPGDKVHTLENIVKIVSGSDGPALDMLCGVYGQVVTAGLHRASSIRVAEAAKVIENTQRDLNIALMNELAMIFDHMDIDTLEVLEAAGTKWNFLPFRPGLVGGHCIGVDPYYLTFKSQAMGYHPEMILAGRRINDSIGKFVAERTVKMLIGLGKQVRRARIAILGITFKENVPDLRNTKVVDIVRELREYEIDVLMHDPLADPGEAKEYYNLDLRDMEELQGVDGVILAVAHEAYMELGLAGIVRLCSEGASLVVDVKGAFSPGQAKSMNIKYWRL
jgi:UDP-N-acetyl-D-galactosamine dehydrogenase